MAPLPAPQLPMLGVSVTSGMLAARAPKTCWMAARSAASTAGTPVPNGMITSTASGPMPASASAASTASMMPCPSAAGSTPSVSGQKLWLAPKPASSAMAVAPRALAVSMASSTRRPPPSPGTQPLASGANGRTTLPGSSPGAEVTSRLA